MMHVRVHAQLCMQHMDTGILHPAYSTRLTLAVVASSCLSASLVVAPVAVPAAYVCLGGDGN